MKPFGKGSFLPFSLFKDDGDRLARGFEIRENRESRQS